MDTETKKAWQMFAAGIAACLLGFAIIFIRQNHPASPIGQWINSWYDWGYMKRAGIAAGGRTFFQKYGDIFTCSMIGIGGGVAWITGKHLYDEGALAQC